jgi:hypothetical protein
MIFVSVALSAHLEVVLPIQWSVKRLGYSEVAQLLNVRRYGEYGHVGS